MTTPAQYAEMECERPYKTGGKPFTCSRFPAELPPWDEELPECPSCGGPTQIRRLLERREVLAPVDFPNSGHTTIGWELDEID
jgi:transposase